jgi:hypothetical protein
MQPREQLKIKQKVKELFFLCFFNSETFEMTLVLYQTLISLGKTNRKPIKHSSANLRSITRVDRRNAAKLEQQKKREEVLKANRFFEGRHGTPKIVV